jgi:hypothetical protein
LVDCLVSSSVVGMVDQSVVGMVASMAETMVG